MATSLDGFIARPDGELDWLGDPPEDGEDYGWAGFLASLDAIVMGRATFEKVLSFGVWPYGELPLTVLSSTLREVPRHLAGTVDVSGLAPAALLAELGERGRRRIYVDGGRTVQSFMAEGLIDELVLTTIPVLIGQGIPLFGALKEDVRWQHVSTDAFASGLVQSTYRRR